MSSESRELRTLLKQVSRSFYLTLRVLPAAIRPQMGAAYLLARASDTIADTRLVATRDRNIALHALRAAILASSEGRGGALPDFGELAAAQPVAAGQGSAAERILLLDIGKVLDSLRQFDIQDRQRIREALDVITGGQELDLARFGSASQQQLAALDTDGELDDYTYRVAGCVGEFWTRMCRAHLFPNAHVNDTFLLSSSVRFGKGLQLVNIVRDLPADLRQGRCYIPARRLMEHGLAPRDLLNPAVMERFRALYVSYLQLAEEHLAAGWAYTNALPRAQVRIRLACAWPILIGVRTLAQLRKNNVLDERQRIRIGRSEIRKLMLRSILCYPRWAAWARLFESSKNG